MTEFAYAGSELAIFERAHHWKAYFSSILAPHLRGEVLEVGAGIGANTRFLEAYGDHWTCLDPDRQLLNQLAASLPASGTRELMAGTVSDLDPGRKFDAVLYLDVLEHIADDAGELRRAAGVLRASGRLIVLAPAHQWLFNPFDKRIGHHRRYSKKSLLAAAPAGLRLERLLYLDSAGLVASAGNRLLLRQDMPTFAQIESWDRWLVPVSRWLDPLLGYHFGKSVLAIWSKPANRTR